MPDKPPWTAPAVERTDHPMVAGEVEAVTGFLEWHRETFLVKCSGLTGEQLAERAVPPSSMSLLGLLRHLTEVERIWFRERVAGEDAPPPYKTPDNWDADFDDLDPADAEAAYARYLAECDEARRVAAGRSLDEQVTTTDRRGTTYTFDLRWLMLHMVEEYARHLGHADLLREKVDGVTGA